MGEGEEVGDGLGESDGAGMKVTSGDGVWERRRCDGEGEGGGGGGDDSSALRVGDGSGGITPVGELDASALAELAVGFGVGAAVVEAGTGVPLGAGAACGDAAPAGVMSNTGTTARLAPASSTETRTPATREL